MYGMLNVLLATGTWLILASYWELPVSTTHSTVGGVIGMAVTAYGSSAVVWYEPSDSFPYMEGVAAIVLSWIISPVLSGIFSAVLFGTVRATVLRSQNSYARSWWVFPILVFVTVLVNAYFVIYKGAGSKTKDMAIGTALWISAVAAAASTLIVVIGVIPFLKKRINTQEERSAAAEAAKESGEKDPEAPTKVEEVAVIRSPMHAKWESMKQIGISLSKGATHDVHEAIDTDEDVHAIHEFSEKFDPKTEESFKYLQVFTAICDSFSHGANDVANSIGPFAAIWAIYQSEGIAKKSAVPTWILVLGGFGIVLGLATYGYKIMCAIGVKMCRITPSRGFAIELGAAIVIVVGSQLGIPLSTTHCQVGSTIGVGLLESVKKGVNWKLVGRVVVGWVMTLIVVGLTTSALFAQGIYAPSIINVNERNYLQGGIESNVDGMIAALNQTVYTSVDPSLTGILEHNAQWVRNMSNPLKYIYAQHVPVEDSITLLSNTTFTTLSTMVPLSGGDLSVVTDDGNSIFYQMS
uniref:Phosphate transporter n=1 Tax=Tetraselmis chuii TaxID=63592 RepID=A0A7S1X941_9CHLO|mmetsp:Transcript_41011/g.73710  ORF Transcript_41011/g.73710 Transcript_41011/m.73710 type:complete len:522 (+) Transcript_41011:234-1799(+)